MRHSRWISRLSAALLIGALACLALLPAGTHAQAAYPSKPIRLWVNSAAGGTADLVARLFASKLEEELGIRVVVENPTEAGGTRAVRELQNADPDGYILLTTFLPRLVQQEILLEPGYDSRALTPIANIVRGAFSIATRRDGPFKDFRDLVQASEQRPLSIGMMSIGSASHLQAVRLLGELGLNARLVPFSSGPPAAAAAMGGHVDASVITVNESLINKDDLRILAVFGAERVAEAPDAPSITEFGFQAAEVSFYQPLFGPPGLPADVMETLTAATHRVLNDPDFIQRLTEMGETWFPLDGEVVGRLVEDFHRVVMEYKDDLMAN